MCYVRFDDNILPHFVSSLTTHSIDRWSLFSHIILPYSRLGLFTLRGRASAAGSVVPVSTTQVARANTDNFQRIWASEDTASIYICSGQLNESAWQIIYLISQVFISNCNLQPCCVWVDSSESKVQEIYGKYCLWSLYGTWSKRTYKNRLKKCFPRRTFDERWHLWDAMEHSSTSLEIDSRFAELLSEL